MKLEHAEAHQETIAARPMLQAELITKVAERPDKFAWFLGAGASRTAGLPTASDIIWDLKRRYYRQEENREVSPQDIQNDAIRTRIQEFMDARGFPPLWADEEYSRYFEKIFGDDRERQRRYLRAMLAEDAVTLSVGNRVLAALMIAGLCRVVFTTNFDSVVEKSVAEVGGNALQAYSLEGTKSATSALLNEEYPFYCKLHGDFRFESLKNLSDDLRGQDEELTKAFVAAGARFGLIVAGYSGRDASVMGLMHRVLEAPNPFPHGIYWTGLKGFSPHPAVLSFLGQARAAGVVAEYIEIETFDAMMSRLWRSVDNKPLHLDAKVRKAKLTSVTIPLAPVGNAKPLIRMNALPLRLPGQCSRLSLTHSFDWKKLRDTTRDFRDDVIVTMGERVLAWGAEADIRACFGASLVDISLAALPTDFQVGENLHVKSFLEDALIRALARDRPLLARQKPSCGYLIVDDKATDVGALEPLHEIVGRTSGTLEGIFSPVDADHPERRPVRWAEALRVSLDQRDGRPWLLIEPDIWIWPAHARSVAVEFLDKRKGSRFNSVHNRLLNAWSEIIFGTAERNIDMTFRSFVSGADHENPSFLIGSRTAYARRILG